MQKIPNVLDSVSGPQQGADVYVCGEITTQALVLLHGRGGGAADIVTLYEALGIDVYTLVPEAIHNTWYPHRFLVPQVENQPALDSALGVITALLMHLEAVGIPKEKTVLAGFSQGACLVAEYLKRYPASYGGAVVMSGGLIGSETEVAQLLSGSLADTPIYLGCDTQDTHIPIERVAVTAKVFKAAGAALQVEVFSDYGHRPHNTALAFLGDLLRP